MRREAAPGAAGDLGCACPGFWRTLMYIALPLKGGVPMSGVALEDLEIGSSDLALVHEVYRMRLVSSELLYHLLGASRIRTGPYRRVSRLLAQGYLETFVPPRGVVVPRSCRQLLRVGPVGLGVLVRAGLAFRADRPPYVRAGEFPSRLQAVEWYVRARACGVPADALFFRDEYRSRFRWGPHAPGDLALVPREGSSALVLVRFADLGERPLSALVRLLDAWGSRCALAVVVPDEGHAGLSADLADGMGEPPVPLIPSSDVGTWLHARWAGAEDVLSLALVVVEERLGQVEAGSALSEYPSFVASFTYRGRLFGLASLLDPAVEPERVLSDLRLFRPSDLPGRYRGVVVVVRTPEQAVWLAKRVPGGPGVWVVPASHPRVWYRLRGGSLRPALPPGG